MIAPGTILCAIPRECWGGKESKNLPVELLRRFLIDLDTIERRTAKKIAFDDECYRYSRLCGQIEDVVLSNMVFAPTRKEFKTHIKQGHFPVIRIGSEYVDFLRLVQLKIKTDRAREKIGASVFSPYELSSHIKYFTKVTKSFKYQYPSIKDREWFVKKRILPQGCGLIEVPDSLSVSLLNENQLRQDGVDGRDLWERFVEYLKSLVQNKEPEPTLNAEERRTQVMANIVTQSYPKDWEQYGTVHNRGDFMKDRLKNQIQDAITDGIPINLMNQRQNMLTVHLQEFIHKKQGQEPIAVPITYNDGGAAKPFPLHCVPRMRYGWVPSKEYHFALVSMRHLPLDQYIDMNWFRNVEVPAKEGLTVADESCYQVSKTQLSELLGANHGQRIRIHLYHTGYMPAIVGFYRAVMSILTSTKFEEGCLQILPKLQPGKDGFVEGKPWPE